MSDIEQIIHEFPPDHWWKRLLTWIVVEGCLETQRQLKAVVSEVDRRWAAAMVFVLEFVEEQET